MLHFYTAGESHGQALLAFLSGLPAGLPVDLEFINRELHRRQLGYGRGGRQKIEKDRADIFAGVRHGQTIGAPIALRIENRDWANWEKILAVEAYPKTIPPQKNYWRRVPATPIWPVRKNLIFTTPATFWSVPPPAKPRRALPPARSPRFCCDRWAPKSPATPFKSAIPASIERPPGTEIQAISNDMESPLRCVDSAAQDKMKAEVDAVLKAGDTVGGIFEVVAHNVPVGLGCHAQWDEKLDGKLAQAVMSVQAVKGVEIGAGIVAAGSLGSEVQDEISYDKPAQRFARSSNRAGGLEGGITNGEDVVVRGYLKPISTLRRALRTADMVTKEPVQAAYERSDWCVVPAGAVAARSHGGTCPGRCFSAKIWRRLPCRDAPQLSRTMPDKSTSF